MPHTLPDVDLDPGLVALTAEDGTTLTGARSRRATALHHLVADVIADRAGTTYWLDARNAASTYALQETLGRDRLATVQVARAFTAYQHHELVRHTVREIDDPALVVAPNVAALYRDDDVPSHETGPLFAATLTTLQALAHAATVPVVVTAAGDDDLATTVDTTADATVTVEATRCGLRIAGEDHETQLYRDRTGWQTTVPYWVELFGAVDREPGCVPTPPAALTPDLAEVLD
ncbi:MAG: hypothetical protein ABEJ57_09100 [Halobacteriaceae archaeon]